MANRERHVRILEHELNVRQVHLETMLVAIRLQSHFVKHSRLLELLDRYERYYQDLQPKGNAIPLTIRIDRDVSERSGVVCTLGQGDLAEVEMMRRSKEKYAFAGRVQLMSRAFCPPVSGSHLVDGNGGVRPGSRRTRVRVSSMPSQGISHNFIDISWIYLTVQLKPCTDP